jgi:Tfp pilus assembly protein PilN
MALRDINLLPAAALERRLLLRHAVAWGLVYGLALAVIIGGHLGYAKWAMPERTHSITDKQARTQLAEIISEIDRKNEEIERLAFVRHVSFAFETSEILGCLADIMDPKTWLTKVSLRATAEGAYALNIKGLAYSNARRGTTIRALTTDPHFENVVFKDAVDVKPTITADDAPEHIVQFTVEAQVIAE